MLLAIRLGLLLLSVLVSLLSCSSPHDTQNHESVYFADSHSGQLPQNDRLSQREAKRRSFQDFLKNFREIATPLAIPIAGLARDRFLPKDILAKIESCQIDRYLTPHLPNFDTEAEDEIFENFNFPDFKSHDYFYYVRPRLDLNVACIVFYLYNNFSSYFGLVSYKRDGEFIDQLFVAGREGGSGSRYTLEGVIQPDHIVELRFERVSWGKDMVGKSATTRRYEIQPNGRIVRLPR